MMDQEETDLKFKLMIDEALAVGAKLEKLMYTETTGPRSAIMALLVTALAINQRGVAPGWSVEQGVKIIHECLDILVEAIGPALAEAHADVKKERENA